MHAINRPVGAFLASLITTGFHCSNYPRLHLDLASSSRISAEEVDLRRCPCLQLRVHMKAAVLEMTPISMNMQSTICCARAVVESIG